MVALKSAVTGRRLNGARAVRGSSRECARRPLVAALCLLRAYDLVLFLYASPLGTHAYDLPSPAPLVHCTPRRSRQAHDHTMSQDAPTARSSTPAAPSLSPIASPYASAATPVSYAIPSSSPASVDSAAGTSTPSSATDTTPLLLASGFTAFATSAPLIAPNLPTTFIGEIATTSSSVATAFPNSAVVRAVAELQPVCIGDGVDAASLGLLSTLLVPSVIGLFVWVSFVALVDAYMRVSDASVAIIRVLTSSLSPSVWP